MDIFSKKYFDAIKAFDAMSDKDHLLYEEIFKVGYELGYQASEFRSNKKHEEFMNNILSMDEKQLKAYKFLYKGLMEIGKSESDSTGKTR